MKYNIGDIFICKENINNIKGPIFIKYNSYKIEHIIGDQDDYEMFTIFLRGEQNLVCNYYIHTMVNYFYTQKEYRKLKLLKLKNMEKTIKERLSEKIDIAVNLGVKFLMHSQSTSASSVSHDTFVVYPGWEDEEFEKNLDITIKSIESRTFISILKEKKLI